jgi:transcriptional regulator with XRE-family HTH domain
VPSNKLSLSLSEHLRALRKQRKLTQEKAASLIGCDYKYYQSLEAGSKDVRLSMLERIAKAFGIKAAVLLDTTPARVRSS